ncbi:amino acid permease-domain-containing protein [Collybia nuda]|uniref:Amino acid permease-domain-containing protein n=1 Tax=Collybia nuda TaxID=64659 RepID=A0A9P5XYQ9_9AGAR|nr:amino acid permease-domain-containing protein [Collybia nuda]
MISHPTLSPRHGCKFPLQIEQYKLCLSQPRSIASFPQMSSIMRTRSAEKGQAGAGLEHASDHDQVVENLEKLGYKQELVRTRGLSHALFMTLSIMAVPYGLSAPIATSLIGGGPATIIWGWLHISILTLPLALSMGEICSKYPTAAGAYYWCYRLTPPRYRVLASWINGWLTMVGVWTICLSVTFGTAQLVVAGVGIFHPDWAATPWQTYLIFVAVTAVTFVFVIFFNDFLPIIDMAAAFWTLLGIIIILIGFSAKAAAGRRSAAFALGHFDPSSSGWKPGWTYFIGLLPPAYTYAAIGMIANMAEEVQDPSSQVPRAMVWSVPIGAVCGLVFLLPITFTLPDIPTLLAVPTGQPIGVMFELIMGSRPGGFGMWFIIFGIGMFCAISICCAASRATWSFARDKAIPFHHTFSQVNHTLSDVPMNAHILSTMIQLLLGLIYLGSSAAFNAFVGVAVICLGTSYSMPVAISLVQGRKDMADAPYSLGKWGPALNLIAVLWTTFEIVLFSMPAVIPVTKVSMNYASVVFVGFAAISAVWYIINGRFHYTGPPLPNNGPEDDESKTEGEVQTL